jgi:hypothetical protein
MTYGTYTPDLKACGLSGQSLEDAKRYCLGNKVVCSERDVTVGFAVRFAFTKNWEWRIRWSWQCADFGFVHVSWERLHHLWADKIVWTKEGGDHA